ncbi:unnamed protein product [Meloidogyne enterolobii]|uniref:Uncharacterized protein n=1 Tax=Meloidogyne enterolobii TaxID=390850 RepID=A0ACB0XZ00_MELEN
MTKKLLPYDKEVDRNSNDNDQNNANHNNYHADRRGAFGGGCHRCYYWCSFCTCRRR